MQKRKKGRKLSRKRDQRKALLVSLASALILKGKIRTTEAKAKEVAGFIAKYITRAKSDNLQSRRILAKSFTQEVVKKLLSEIGPKYLERKGGYTRIIKLGPRKSDSAKIASIELV